MSRFTMEAQTIDEAVRNRGGDPTIPPDRFARLPGNNNWRSGKIANYQQLKMLRDKYGIRTIVNIAKDSMAHQTSGDGFECYYAHPADGDPCEPKWVAALGMRYISAYLGGSPPDNAEWPEIREALRQGNTLVHCTHGVDRTGAVAGRWVSETTGLTGQALLDYTYDFGGQWTMPSDPNHKLRDWLVAAQYDQALVDSLSRGTPWGMILGITGAGAVLAAVIYRVRFK